MARLHTGQGMRRGKIKRVKRQLVREVVADNLATIRGLPPRPLRRRRRLGHWLGRFPLVLVPLTLAGSTYYVSTTTADTAPPPRMRLASLAPLPPASALPR